MMKYAWYDTQSKGRVYVLLEPYEFSFGGNDFVVPAGFESDGLSAPKWSWWLFTPARDTRTLEAAIIHDWLYATGKVSRKDADLLFLQMLRKLGYEYTGLVAYVVLRLFGASHFKK